MSSSEKSHLPKIHYGNSGLLNYFSGLRKKKHIVVKIKALSLHPESKIKHFVIGMSLFSIYPKDAKKYIFFKSKIR